MNLAQGLLVAALVVVALTHTMSRVGGALATMVWCVAAVVFGVAEFDIRGHGLIFLGIQTPPWLFFAAMVGVFGYNGAIVWRAVRGRRRSPP